MTFNLNLLISTVIVCFIISAFVAGFWYAIYRIRKHHKKRECEKVRKAILACLREEPLERREILEWLEAQDICNESDGDYEIDNLLGSEFIKENEDSRYTESNDIVIIDDEKQKLEITPKGKQKLQTFRKK